MSEGGYIRGEGNIGIFGTELHLDFIAVYDKTSVGNGSAVFDDVIARNIAASGIEEIPIDFVAHTIDTIGKLGGEGEGGRIEDIAAADCLACTVAAIAITVGNDIGAFGWLSIRLDGSIERTIVAEIEIDKTVHPCGGIGYICVYEKTGEERIF